ncbi:MAG: hypothetical protein ACRDD7_14685 [Peptostreptococcaceae bacterium]
MIIKRSYCEKWDAYYSDGKWIESTGCDKDKSCSKCPIKCFNRPEYPCSNCSNCSE